MFRTARTREATINLRSSGRCTKGLAPTFRNLENFQYEKYSKLAAAPGHWLNLWNLWISKRFTTGHSEPLSSCYQGVRKVRTTVTAGMHVNAPVGTCTNSLGLRPGVRLLSRNNYRYLQIRGCVGTCSWASSFLLTMTSFEKRMLRIWRGRKQARLMGRAMLLCRRGTIRFTVQTN